MATTFHIDIVSAEKPIYSGSAEMLIATAAQGEVGILPGHSQLLTSLKPGLVRLTLRGGGEEVFYISGGFLEVQPHLVTVLADTAERAHDLDEMRALEAERKARQVVEGRQSETDYAQALSELAQATAQLQAIRRIRKKIGG